MIDFPNSPGVGQIFTSGTSSWQWDGTKWVAVSAPQSVAPNKLVNPFMEIDQSNEGAALTNISAAYIVDGVGGQTGSVGAITGQRITDAPPGFPNSVRLTVATAAAVAAGTYCMFDQSLEGDDIADTKFGTASAQSISLAFWLKSSVAGLYSVAVRNGIGANRSYVFTVSLSSANTWQLFTQTIPGDTAGTWTLSGNAKGLQVNMCASAGSTWQTATLNAWQNGNFLAANTAMNTFSNTAGATIQLGPCGLWVAPAPQPLLRASFAAELARCQRYYEKSYDIGVAPGTVTNNGTVGFQTQQAGAANFLVTLSPKVTKRATPTVTAYSNQTGAVNKWNYFNLSVNADATVGAQFNGTQQSQIYASITSVVGGQLFGHYTLDARL